MGTAKPGRRRSTCSPSGSRSTSTSAANCSAPRSTTRTFRRMHIAVIPGDGIGHARDILLGTRFELDLYVNYRPVRLLDDRLCPLKDRSTADVNFVVFRENTEGVYVGVGGRFKAGTVDEVAIQEEINPYKGVHRILRYA